MILVFGAETLERRRGVQIYGMVRHASNDSLANRIRRASITFLVIDLDSVPGNHPCCKEIQFPKQFEFVPTLKEPIMSLQSSPNFLRYVLWIDAISCLICGLSQVAFTGTLSEWLGLSATLLAGTGEFLLLYGVVVAFLAARSRTPGAIIWLLIVGNAAWAVACIACLLGSGGTITLLGKVYVIAQALTVAVLALLQYSGMRGHDARQGSQRSVNA